MCTLLHKFIVIFYNNLYLYTVLLLACEFHQGIIPFLSSIIYFLIMFKEMSTVSYQSRHVEVETFPYQEHIVEFNVWSLMSFKV